jgi:hypothetical protein
MRFAYADPPYLGCGKLYDAHHANSREYDDPEAHRRLVTRLCDEFPDGWAMSLHTPSLHVIAPMLPPGHRVGAWVKPFAVFKPNVNPAYAWEPVVFMGGRKRGRDMPTLRDWLACNITLRKGLTGAKPREVCDWILDWLNVQPGDEMHDLFPGTGVMAEAFNSRVGQGVFA